MVHTYFSASDEEDNPREEQMHVDGPQQPQAGRNATGGTSRSSGGSTFQAASAVYPQCVASVRVDFHASDPCYVFKAVMSPGMGQAAASLSNNRIKLYSLHEAGLTATAEIDPAHGATISDVAYPLADYPHALFSAGCDGALRGWDTRTSTEAERCVVLRAAWYAAAHKTL
jgi:hypothetical protein